MLTIVSVLLASCLAFAAGKRFHAHDHVGIVANTVGPFNNPTETYPVLLISHYTIFGENAL